MLSPTPGRRPQAEGSRGGPADLMECAERTAAWDDFADTARRACRPRRTSGRLRRFRGLASALLPFRLALPRRRRCRPCGIGEPRRRAGVSPWRSRSFRSATCLSASRSCMPPSRSSGSFSSRATPVPASSSCSARCLPRRKLWCSFQPLSSAHAEPLRRLVARGGRRSRRSCGGGADRNAPPVHGGETARNPRPGGVAASGQGGRRHPRLLVSTSGPLDRSGRARRRDDRCAVCQGAGPLGSRGLGRRLPRRGGPRPARSRRARSR